MTESRRKSKREGAPAKIIAGQISDQLGEKEFGPRRLVQSIVEVCGEDFAMQMMQEAIEIEAQGGMLLLDGSRRRTLGGVFFYLARGRMSPEARKAVFPTRARRKAGSGKGKQPQPPQTQPSLIWQHRKELLPPLLAEQGEATTVKITLIGRPGRVEVQKDVVVTTMSHSARSATLPKGVPQPPETPTVYTVYIASKQWNKVAEALQDPQDALIIEGLCAFDPELGAIAVFAQSTTTKALEAAKREAQRQKQEAEAGESAAATNGETPAAKPKARANPDMQPQQMPVFNIPAGASSADAQKLRELHAAADLYRQKLADMEQRNQRFGQEMTQKLLKSVEDQIHAIEQKYT